MPKTLAELTDNFLGGFEGCALFEVVDNFRREKPLGEMMSYLLGLPEAHQYLTPKEDDSKEHKKDYTKAQEARAIGNQYFKKEQYEMALDEYSRSIMLAPHPPHRNYPTAEQSDEPLDDSLEFSPFLLSEEEDPEMHELSLSYANRSAALMELKLYGSCLRDIDLALKFGFPKKLRYKLINRWAKCLILTKNNWMAVDLLIGALTALDNIPSIENIRIKARNILIQTYEQCRDVHESGLPVYYLPRAPMYTKWSFQAPEVDHPNPSIPVLMETITLAHSEAKGRHLMATRDIFPGETLAIENRYATVLQCRPKKLICTNCFKENILALPCPECSEILFCGLNCQKEALSKYHKIECPIWPALQSLCLPPHVLLACRVLTTTSFETLKKEEPRLRREAETRQKATLGCNKKGMFISSEYRAVYHLNTNQEHRPHLDVFNACISAFVLLKLLQRSGRFFSKGGQAVTASDEDLLLVGTALSSHILSLSCNSIPINHVVCEKSYKIENFGLGIFPTLSLANHSCDPTAITITCGATAGMIANRSIPKGGEVTRSYGVTHLQMPRERRRALLLEAYHFHCKCEACELNWPMADHLPRELNLKCLKCSRRLDRQAPLCKNCNIDYGKPLSKKERNFNKRFFFKDTDLEIKTAKHWFDHALTCPNECTRIMSRAYDLLKLLDKYTIHPNHLGYLVRSFWEKDVLALAIHDYYTLEDNQS